MKKLNYVTLVWGSHDGTPGLYVIPAGALTKVDAHMLEVCHGRFLDTRTSQGEGALSDAFLIRLLYMVEGHRVDTSVKDALLAIEEMTEWSADALECRDGYWDCFRVPVDAGEGSTSYRGPIISNATLPRSKLCVSGFKH